MDSQFFEIEFFVPKTEAAWSALQRQYTRRITEAEIDHLFACFVFGLTSPAYGERKPSLHLDVCRALVALKLPPDRADVALHEVPEPTAPWVAGAYRLIESKGVTIGRLLQENMRNFEGTSVAEAGSAAEARQVNNEDECNDRRH